MLLQLVRGPSYSAAIVTGLTAMALLALRDDFPFSGDPAAEPSALPRLGGMLLFAMVYGVTALWIYRTASDLPYSFGSALLDTVRAMGGQLPGDVDLLPTEFADWFPVSVLSIAAIGVLWAAAVWIRPWRQRLFPDPRGSGQAAEIVHRWGTDTLAPFALRSDEQWFVTGRTLIAYRVVRGIALVSGDPVGPAGEARMSAEAFLAYAGPAAGAPRSWALPAGFSTSTGNWACTRSTTATRRSSTSRASPSTAGACAPPARPCTGSNATGTAPR